MKPSWLTLIALLLAALCWPLAPTAAGQTPINSYTTVLLDGMTTVYGINDAGQVVGEAVSAAGESHAFLWQNGALTDLGTLGGSRSIPFGINIAGQVVGSSDTGIGVWHAFLWTAESGMRDLGTLGGSFSEAHGVNDAGQVVGIATTAAGVRHAFLWQSGIMMDLGTLGGSVSEAYGINASGQVVGYAYDAGGQTAAFRWTPTVPNGTSGIMVALDSTGASAAYSLNASGQAAGENNGYATLWDSLGRHDLAGWSYTGAAYAINGSRRLVGRRWVGWIDYDYYGDPYLPYRAVVWDPQTGDHDLSQNSNTREDLPVGEARGINASGQIVANAAGYSIYSGYGSYLLNPSPVPTCPHYPHAVFGSNPTSVYVTWSTFGPADYYNVKRSTTSGGPYTTIASAPTIGYSDSAVVNTTAYYYVVSAVNSWGESGDSVETVAVPVPPAPTGLTATAGDQQVSLSWNASAWAEHYEVYSSTTPGGPYGFIDYVYDTNSVEYPLNNGTMYYFVVVAVNDTGQSGSSNEASATPVAPPPPLAPTGLTATAGNSQVSLSWNASDVATSYTVKRATSSGGPYTVIASPTGTVFTDGGISNGTTYYYVVSASNSGGEGPNSNEASARPLPPPPATPTKLTATASKGKVALKWTQSTNAGVVQNRVYRSSAGGSPYVLVKTISPAATTYTDTSVTSGKTYYYVVTASDTFGQESGYSNQASAKAR